MAALAFETDLQEMGRHLVDVLEAAKTEIAESIEAMRELMEDGSDNSVNEDNCTLTDFIYLCPRCQFKEICYPDSWRDL